MDVICVGEMVIDFIPGNEPLSYICTAGGAPANVAIAVSRNGFKAGFIGKVGNDNFGRFLIKTLEEDNVDFLCRELTSEAITTMVFVTVFKDGERSFTFAQKKGADKLLTIDDIDVELIRTCKIVHAGSCSLSANPASEATRFALSKANELGKLVSFDVNYRNLLWDNKATAKNKVHEILPYIDILKISEEEADMVGGESNIFNIMKDNDITLILETLGADGAKCFFKDHILHVAGRKTQAVDTTGAGDAFWGGFISNLLEQNVITKEQITDDAILKAMNYGNIAGWHCVQQKGAIPSLPTREQIIKHI